MTEARNPASWPALPSREWIETLEALHMWTQIVGKVRMVRSPWLNHSWSVPLYVTASGLGTSLVPYDDEGFELEFDFGASALRLRTTRGDEQTIRLEPRSVADFYRALMEALESVGMPVAIHPEPNEVPDGIPFHEDERARPYDAGHARALWRALLRANHVFTRFRAGFLGKSSPVHFFWGSFDLAVTRFSGRSAPAHPGGLPAFPDEVAREAYSHEVTSAGFWPGNRAAPTPLFYAYAYPTHPDFARSAVEPAAASWHEQLGEFVLPYDALLASPDPDQALIAFLESTHAAAADLAAWPRPTLECVAPRGPDWWQDRIRPAALGNP